MGAGYGVGGSGEWEGDGVFVACDFWDGDGLVGCPSLSACACGEGVLCCGQMLTLRKAARTSILATATCMANVEGRESSTFADSETGEQETRRRAGHAISGRCVSAFRAR